MGGFPGNFPEKFAYQTTPPSDQIQQKLESNNVFLIARRQVDVGGVNQDLMYMSLKFINNIWVLVEVKVAPGATTVGVSVTSLHC